MTSNEELEAQLTAPLKQENVPKRADYLHTGSTLLNLQCSGFAEGGFAKGKYHLLVGDSASGKTWLSMTCLAEACINPLWADHRLIYNGSEGGALMDLARYFGGKMAERVELVEPSQTIEDFYDHAYACVSKGPCIYIEDSMDVLTSEAEVKKVKQNQNQRRGGEATTGSYGDGKAKINSARLRTLLGPLEKHGSILIIINQTRDNLGMGFETKTRSGGHALTFYASLELWTSLAGKIKKEINGKDRVIGVISKIKVKKNRYSGKQGEVLVPIYYSHGIDDVGSCVDYLVEEGHWKKSGRINATEFEKNLYRDQLVQYIEDKDLQEDLVDIVQTVWDKVEAACAIKRKNKYQ